MPLKISKAYVVIAEADGKHAIYYADVIDYEGKFWLVPQWIDMPAQKSTTPLRIVSLETMKYHHLPGRKPEFVVQNPVPRYVFDGQIPSEKAAEYIVIESPDIRIPRDMTHH